MRAILQKRPLRFVFAANVISMLGSGMNSAAVAWYILQATHSEMALGTFAVVQTIPAMLMLPFTGVIIDREDRRRLVMVLDAARAVIILAVSILAFMGKAKVWELYLMNMLVAAGFWMFWPTITALIQELTPGDEFVHANTFLLAGIQGGWLIAGSIVGFVYDHIGLGGVLLIDFSTYLVSFLCYFAVRKGRHVVPRPAELHHDIVAAETALSRFGREMREGFGFLRHNRRVIFLGISWALFLGAMMTGIVVTAPLSDAFHQGAKGYGWLNAGWGTGRISQCTLCSAIHRAYRVAPHHRHLHGLSCDLHDRCAAGANLFVGGSCLWDHGLRPRPEQRRHEHQSHGPGTPTPDGTGSEHVLLCRHGLADRHGADGRRRFTTESGCRICDHRNRVRGSVRQRKLAGPGSLYRTSHAR